MRASSLRAGGAELAAQRTIDREDDGDVNTAVDQPHGSLERHAITAVELGRGVAQHHAHDDTRRHTARKVVACCVENRKRPDSEASVGKGTTGLKWISLCTYTPE